MSEQAVLFEDCGAYGCITLNRPGQHNTLDLAAQLLLQDILRQCLGRFPAIILTGAGTHFSAGTPAAKEKGAGTEYSRQGNRWVETIEMIRRHPAVFIAAVNGNATGDGISLINVCDLAIAADTAEMAMPEITNASYPAVAGPSTQLRILRKHASWMVLTGKPVDARTAARWGLINMAVPVDQVMVQARSVAENIAKFNPVTVDWTKKGLDDIPTQISDWTAALEYGRVITAVVQNQIGKENFMPKKF